MLGVLKRRWKPKRSSTPRINTDSNLDNSICEKGSRLVPSVRQVHPLLDEKAHPLCGDIESSPPPYPKRASLDSNTSPTQCWGAFDCDPKSPQCYPLTPNICVEAGRIQFIRHDSSDTTTQDSTPPASPVLPRTVEARITVTRGLQTDGDVDQFAEAKKLFEERISELEASLELAKNHEQRDRLIISKLQKQNAKRESAHRDADRERRLRIESETRAKQAIQEATRCRSRLKLLTTEFAKMEETVRSMLVYKKQAEQLRQEKTTLTLAFENRCHQYQNTISRLSQEVETLRHQLEQVGYDHDPESLLEAHTVALQRHAEESRKQYEKCLDDVANQVVKALLAQKNLREEVGTLNVRIQELENQNRALTSMLVHQLKSDSYESNCSLQLALQDNNSSSDNSPVNIVNAIPIKHYNSFNSAVLDESPSESVEIKTTDKHTSVHQTSNFDTKFSLEDKKRHQVLTQLWTELKGAEVTPKRLLEALSAVDSALWVPPQRPVSLNLQLPIITSTKYRRARPILAQSSSKSEEETTGNESPESGNRDEGYSTMSSDVQTDVTRSSNDGPSVHNGSGRGLEDLKEATDEAAESVDTRLLVTDSKDPDILYIPLNLLNLKSRNSFPPGRDMLPFQHIMRSFSDSHLCIKITTAPSPCYTFSSPISSSPSIFLVDITEKKKNALRRARGTSTLWGNSNVEAFDEKSSQVSWSSAIDDRLECASWDTEYIQHWLRLDETRTALQQHRDLFELEYDRTELEDWSLSLSNDDLRESWKKSEATTPGQISISTLPSIQENNALELEEDANECLWNNSSYMMDREGRELVTFLMDTSHSQNGKSWPYALASPMNPQASPDNSWSSGGSDCHSYEPETCSKRSSAALSGCSDDTGEIPAIGTDFTRDFYRLVKFESTKSLASTSSRSVQGENADREMTLQNVLTFLAEQQKYAHSKDKEPRPRSANELITKDFVECPVLTCDDSKNSESHLKNDFRDENYVTLKQLCEEASMNEMNLKEKRESEEILLDIKQNIAYAHEVCLVTPLDVESENCSNICDQPVDICSVNIELTSDFPNPDSINESETKSNQDNNKINESLESDLTKSSDTTSSDISVNNGSESLTSSVSTPETIISKIPRRKLTSSKLPLSPSKTAYNNNETKIPKIKVPHKSPKLRPPSQKQKILHVQPKEPTTHLITSERLPQSTAGTISNIINGPPHRAVSFHERATSKDVIDELNRMIKNGEENVIQQEQVEQAVNVRLDQSCKPTGWIHVERDIDLTDPKARANLLDVMMASVSSDSSPTSSCGGSVTSETTEDPPDYGHLHRIHRCHRQKKANAIRPEMAVVRASQAVSRPTIIGRTDFFVRYGEKEKEAVASFDFLDNLSTSGSSVSCSLEDEDIKGCGDIMMQFQITQV
ncbi:uncharacterized protein LOC123313336 isoform X2 [Coccinella septempunctata]|uniref:uncharacterized protein LOC123313336 isoform X2 n=1 Tax=Coccinella septempunctata TaxID=41139 RepID=UPI001D089192|nr:uncharacterized protein LOC123313336 isoform X2 [Coccinella septempunctata]